MKRKSWIIPILVFFISLGILFSYQKVQDINSFADTTELPPILWSKSPSDISKIMVSLGDQHIEAIYTNNEWSLIRPISTEADPLYIYNALTPFVEPIFETVVTTSPENLSQYGIDNYALTLTLYDKEGQRYVIIKGNSADELNDYVYSPLSNCVYTMPKTAFASISTNISKWRAKTFFSFNKKDVNKIQLSYNGQSFTIHTKEKNKTTVFTSDELSQSSVSHLVSFLENSKVENFITDAATDHVLTAYGFDNPTAVCSIYTGSGEPISIAFGKSSKSEGITYARLLHTNRIVALSYINFETLTSNHQ